MARIALLFVIFVGFTGIANSQAYDPDICWGYLVPPWIGPVTAWAYGIPADVLGCDDSDCIVTITYYLRDNPGWGWEFQIATIDFDNCNEECKENAWKCAYWMIAMKYQELLNIDDVNECDDIFNLYAATCWEYSNTSPSLTRYRACGGECCMGVYKLCKRLDTSGEYFTFEKLYPTTVFTNDCETPCEFIDCENTMPSSWIVNVGYPEGGNLIPKLSIYEPILSDNINFYPNPTDGNVIISFDLPEKGTYTISVFDNLGNEILKQEINSGTNLNVEFELKSNSFAVGSYSVVVSGNNGEIMNGKFIKIK